MDVKFTVDVGGARGGFGNVEDAKKEAMRLARLNDPATVTIEDEDGLAVFTFYIDDGKLMMNTITHHPVVIDE